VTCSGTTPRDIACIHLEELLTEYLEDALHPDEAAAIDALGSVPVATCRQRDPARQPFA
jgi:hypothetical protein